MKKTKKERKDTNNQVVCGTVIGHPKGFGFVERDDKGDDVYLPGYEMNAVLHGDRVKIEVKQKRKENKFSGRVVKVLERAHKKISGVVCSYNLKHYVKPLDKRISHDLFLDKSSLEKVKEGDVVEVNITQYPDANKKLKGEIGQIFGAISDADMPITLSLYKHQIPHVWTKSAQIAVGHCPKKIAEAETKSRVDLRHLNFVTIDGKTAKDFDDAILVTKTDDGYVLRVAIADVSHYIKVNSVLDKIAYERGTSVYFPNRVVPMLPEEYSNGICSLKPDVDRLAIVCEIILDNSGNRLGYQFYGAIIQSKARLTYTDVWSYLNNTRSDHIDSDVQRSLNHAYELFEHLLVLRKQRGALELDIPEAAVVFDEQNHVNKIEPVIRNNAHRLIEEFMLSANVCAAEFMLEALDAGIFRVHERPDAERVSDLRYFLSEFSLDMSGGDKPNSDDFVKVLENPAVRKEWKYIISTMMLRTQKQARYSEQSDIHFALNYKSYTHFTSPIRRYPDLIVHRLLKAIITKSKPAEKLLESLSDIAEHCSMTERKAEEASREVISYYKLKYLQDQVGDSFDGVITGVSSFGCFVELNEVLTSGLVHVTSLGDDFYLFDPLKQQLIGERTAKILKIGNNVRVQISRVDLEDKKLDLVIEGQDNVSNKNNKRKYSKSKPPRKS